MTITDTDKARALTLLKALKLELVGMKRSGRSAYAIVKEEFGFRGNKRSVYGQLQRYVWDHVIPLKRCAVYHETSGWVYVQRGSVGYWPWDGIPYKGTPEQFNELVGATRAEQREDMLSQSMFGWRVS